MVRMAGRRMVTMFAGAPAILLTNSTITEALSDAKLHFKAMKFTVDELRLDTINLTADLSVEAEACGCQIRFSDRALPTVVSHPIKTLEDIRKLRIPDPYQDGRMPVFIETMKLLKDNYTMIKIAEVLGPFTLAAHLGGESTYMNTRANPELLHTLLVFCVQAIISYAQALIKAGADIILIAEPTGSMLSPISFDEFSRTYTNRIIDSLDKPVILHICGNANHLIEKMCETGAVAISVDEVDPSSIIDRIPPDMVIIGNISPVKIMWQGAPEDVRQETLKLLESMSDKNEYVVAPGCDLVPETPLENIKAFVEVIKPRK
jgi:MtaA/CmuA family methyltransferase